MTQGILLGPYRPDLLHEETLAEGLAAAEDSAGEGQGGDEGLEAHLDEAGLDLLKDGGHGGEPGMLGDKAACSTSYRQFSAHRFCFRRAGGEQSLPSPRAFTP